MFLGGPGRNRRDGTKVSAYDICLRTIALNIRLGSMYLVTILVTRVRNNS